MMKPNAQHKVAKKTKSLFGAARVSMKYIIDKKRLKLTTRIGIKMTILLVR